MKKVFAVLIAAAIIFNVAGFMNVSASAEGEEVSGENDLAMVGVDDVAVGVAVGVITSAFVNMCKTGLEKLGVLPDSLTAAYNNAASNGDFIGLEKDENGSYIAVKFFRK